MTILVWKMTDSFNINDGLFYYNSPKTQVYSSENPKLLQSYLKPITYKKKSSAHFTRVFIVNPINQNYNKILERDWLSAAWVEH